MIGRGWVALAVLSPVSLALPVRECSRRQRKRAKGIITSCHLRVRSF
jgi:hypothetical protein